MCHHCSKVKVDDSNQRFVRAKKMKDKKRAFQEVWELSKGKFICQLLETEDQPDPEKKKVFISFNKSIIMVGVE